METSKRKVSAIYSVILVLDVIPTYSIPMMLKNLPFLSIEMRSFAWSIHKSTNSLSEKEKRTELVWKLTTLL